MMDADFAMIGFRLVGGRQVGCVRWQGCCKCWQKELFEIVVNHAGDNIEDNALDLGEQCGPLTLGVAYFSRPHKSNIFTELDHNYMMKGLFPANDVHPVRDVSWCLEWY